MRIFKTLGAVLLVCAAYGLLGGLVVIPFYWLYANRPFGLPGHLYLVLGLFCVIYTNLLFGAQCHPARRRGVLCGDVHRHKGQIRLLHHRAHP